MERIVESKWLELEASKPIEFATDKWELMGLFSRKLNKISQEASMQDCNNTRKMYKDIDRGIPPETPKHVGGMLFPGDMIYAYNYCLNAERPVYLILSNVGINYSMRDAYRWKQELRSYLEASNNGSVRGFYEYRNVKDKDTIACMRELSLEEFSSIIDGE